jgi:hypothetical protein
MSMQLPPAVITRADEIRVGFAAYCADDPMRAWATVIETHQGPDVDPGETLAARLAWHEQYIEPLSDRLDVLAATWGDHDSAQFIRRVVNEVIPVEGAEAPRSMIAFAVIMLLASAVEAYMAGLTTANSLNLPDCGEMDCPVHGTSGAGGEPLGATLSRLLAGSQVPSDVPVAQLSAEPGMGMYL